MDRRQWEFSAGDRVAYIPTNLEAVVLQTAYAQVQIEFVSLDGSCETIWVPRESLRPLTDR